MPKVQGGSTTKSTSKGDSSKPYSKPSTKSKSSQPRTGKDSHLYTDDNPKTTLHGTGFKDEATAKKTLQLVSKRSLLYQFQTINTMYFRAKHHPHSTNNKDMQAAMAIFKTWLDETYPAARDAQIKFEPILKKEVVERFLPMMEETEDIDAKWANMYITLPKGKRLANVLMDDEKPGEADMAKLRQDTLGSLAEERGSIEGDDDLWDESGNLPSNWHLKCIAYGWSPVSAQKLAKCFDKVNKSR